MAIYTRSLNSLAPERTLNMASDITKVETYLTKGNVLFTDRGTLPQFVLGDGTLSTGNAVVRVTASVDGQPASQNHYILVVSNESEIVDVVGDKKIGIKIPQTKVDNPYEVTSALGLGVAEVFSETSRPTDPHIKLWSVTGGDRANAVDEREMLEINSFVLDLSDYGRDILANNIVATGYVEILGNLIVGGSIEIGGQDLPDYIEGVISAGGVLGTSVGQYTVGESIIQDDVCALEQARLTGNVFTGYDFGDQPDREKIVFRIFGDGTAFSGNKIRLSKTNTPLDITVRIETDNSGLPSGSLVDGNATATITSASVTTENDYDITWGGSFVIPNGTPCWVVVYQGLPTTDINDYYTIYFDSRYTETRKALYYDGANYYGSSNQVAANSTATEGTEINYSTVSNATPNGLYVDFLDSMVFLVRDNATPAFSIRFISMGTEAEYANVDITSYFPVGNAEEIYINGDELWVMSTVEVMSLNLKTRQVGVSYSYSGTYTLGALAVDDNYFYAIDSGSAIIAFNKSDGSVYQTVGGINATASGTKAIDDDTYVYLATNQSNFYRYDKVANTFTNLSQEIDNPVESKMAQDDSYVYASRISGDLIKIDKSTRNISAILPGTNLDSLVIDLDMGVPIIYGVNSANYLKVSASSFTIDTNVAITGSSGIDVDIQGIRGNKIVEVSTVNNRVYFVSNNEFTVADDAFPYITGNGFKNIVMAKANSNYSYLQGDLGMSSNDFDSGDLGLFTHLGTVNYQKSTLTDKTLYYLSAVAGEIADVVGATTLKVARCYKNNNLHFVDTPTLSSILS